MRIIIGRVARQYGLRVSLSPVPFAGSVGSGSHQHFSMKRDETPLFSGGAGAAGMTPEGESAIAGLLAGLREAQGVLCGSIVSGIRMQPGHWSGAYVCWGTENREAAVRYLIGGPSNPQGANVEVKVIDRPPIRISRPRRYSAWHSTASSANCRRRRRRPSTRATLTDAQREQAGIKLLASSQGDALDALDQSALVRGILGDAPVDAVVAVRRYEQQNFGDLSPDELTEKFRLAWSV